jgi:hypothetical protein
VAVLVGALLAHTPAARAGESGWSETFARAQVASRLPAGELSMVVVAAGGAREARAAADALLASLRTLGRGTALDDTSLGDLSHASDPEVLARCAQLAVEHVAILRWLEAGQGERSRVLVSIYNRRGALVVGFSARAGEPLETRDAIESPQHVVPVAHPRLPPDQYDDAIALYNQQRLEPGEYAGADFYLHIGRGDLAQEYQNRHSRRWMLMLGGAALGVGGFAYMLTGLDSDAGNHMLWGGGIIVVGAIGYYYGTHMSEDPVDEEGRRKLMDDYNLRLEQRLGLRAQRVRGLSLAFRF